MKSKILLHEILLSKGYKAYRAVFDKKTREFNYTECGIPNPFFKPYYNTIQSGGLDVRYVKEENFDGDKFIFGLHEKGLPPTLITPRPSIVVKTKEREIKNAKYSDKYMNHALNNEDHNVIYKAILSKETLYYEIP